VEEWRTVDSSPYPVLLAPREFGSGTAAAFESLVAPHLDVAAGIVVDLGEVVQITSSALGQLVHIGQRLGRRGAALALAGGRRRVVRVFETVGLERVMPLFASVEEARRFLGARSAHGAEAAG
jgi:anti-anti-sigma factor